MTISPAPAVPGAGLAVQTDTWRPATPASPAQRSECRGCWWQSGRCHRTPWTAPQWPGQHKPKCSSPTLATGVDRDLKTNATLSKCVTDQKNKNATKTCFRHREGLVCRLLFGETTSAVLEAHAHPTGNARKNRHQQDKVTQKRARSLARSKVRRSATSKLPSPQARAVA